MAELTEKVEMYRRGISFDDARNILASLRGSDNVAMLKNDKSGETVKLNKGSSNKLVSNPAVDKSVANGFTREQHYAVVSDIAYLFKNARKLLSRPDRDGNPDSYWHIFGTALHFNGAVAYITVKESRFHGKRVYSTELMEIKRLEDVLEEQRVFFANSPASSQNKTSGALEKEAGNNLSLFPSTKFYTDNILDLISKVNSKK